jgi:hypothetical protein
VWKSRSRAKKREGEEGQEGEDRSHDTSGCLGLSGPVPTQLYFVSSCY